MNLRSGVDRVYKHTRATDVGLDPALSSLDLVRIVGRRATQRIRAAGKGCPDAYFGPDVTLYRHGRLRIGTGVCLGRGVLVDALSIEGIELGDRVTIDQHATLRASGVVRRLGVGIAIGNRTAVGAYNVILGQGGVTIGTDCLLGPNVVITSENHVYADGSRRIRDQGEIREPTVIGDDVWIGAGATVLAGSNIGSGAVIGAGSVVRGSLEPYGVYVGVPTRLVGTRRGHK